MSIDTSLLQQITNIITKIDLINNKQVIGGTITTDTIFYSNFSDALQNYVNRNVYTKNISNITSTIPLLNEIGSRNKTYGYLDTLIQDDTNVKTKYNYSMSHDISPRYINIKDALNEKLYTEILSLIHKIMYNDIASSINNSLIFASSIMDNNAQNYIQTGLYIDLMNKMKNKDIDLLTRNIEYLFIQNEHTWKDSSQNILNRISSEVVLSSRISILSELNTTLNDTIQILTKYSNIKTNYLTFELNRVLLGLYDNVDFYFQIQEDAIKELLTNYYNNSGLSIDLNNLSRFARTITNTCKTYSSQKSNNNSLTSPSDSIAKQIFNGEKIARQI